MSANGIIDTGAILAILNPKDRWHDRCVEAFSTLHLPLATTAAVLAEVFHLLSTHPKDIAAAWRLLSSGAVTVLPITDADLPNLDRLMQRYADRPMDFADATLVHHAKRESLPTIFTIDHQPFETYSLHGKPKLRNLPPSLYVSA